MASKHTVINRHNKSNPHLNPLTQEKEEKKETVEVVEGECSQAAVNSISPSPPPPSTTAPPAPNEKAMFAMICHILGAYGCIIAFCALALSIFILTHVGDLQQADTVQQLHISQLALELMHFRIHNKKYFGPTDVDIQKPFQGLMDIIKESQPDCSAYKKRTPENLECIKMTENVKKLADALKQYVQGGYLGREERESAWEEDKCGTISYETWLRNKQNEKTPCQMASKIFVSMGQPFPMPYEIKPYPTLYYNIKMMNWLGEDPDIEVIDLDDQQKREQTE